jgi:hypothetical protein
MSWNLKRRLRGKLFVALLATTVACAAGAQALTPSVASAWQIDGCMGSAGELGGTPDGGSTDVTDDGGTTDSAGTTSTSTGTTSSDGTTSNSSSGPTDPFSSWAAAAHPSAATVRFGARATFGR